MATFYHHNGLRYRIVGATRFEYDYDHGYSEPREVHYNILQAKPLAWYSFFIGWVNIDTEEIPNHAWISYCTLGDTGNWVSRIYQRVKGWEKHEQ